MGAPGVFVVAGNKVDQPDGRRQVSESEARAMLQCSLNLINCTQTATTDDKMISLAGMLQKGNNKTPELILEAYQVTEEFARRTFRLLKGSGVEELYKSLQSVYEPFVHCLPSYQKHELGCCLLAPMLLGREVYSYAYSPLPATSVALWVNTVSV